ncbi:MAG: tRNA (uracil-5-)-methyltransferase [Phenylobacterium sp.]|jgi:tRNA (uracil-5-)-methyltransferase
MSFAAIEPDLYEQHLAAKCERTKALFSDFSIDFNSDQFEVFPSAKTHYRLRAEFRVWHEGDDLYHIMFDPTDKRKLRIDQWLPGSPIIYRLMPILIDKLKSNPVLRKKLFQIDYLSTLSGEILVSLLYHRQLDDQWLNDITALKAELKQQFNIDFIGRAKKQKFMLGRDYVTEQLNINGKSIEYQQVENSFTQPNGLINQQMIEWAINNSKDNGGDLLELYCGNGNFSLALAPHFDRVLATEIAKSSVNSAQHNIAANQIKNVQIIRMSSEEFVEAMSGSRTFRRLKGIDLASYNCNTILVDPPRSGLDKTTEGLVQQYDNILYISCNPQTLTDNLKVLTTTHNIAKFALFDQFPYTEHMECGVYLTRK